MAEIVEGGAFLGHEVDDSKEKISSWAKQVLTLKERQKTEKQEEETPVKKEYFGSDTPKLGFGLMRLPKGKNGKIDVEETKEMVDLFMDAGLTYFDTAYVYDGGDSERAIKEALVDRYPRESYTLATKLCAWMGAHDEKTAKQQFFTSLERTGAGYFDYYLLHALQKDNYKTYGKYHIWDFVKEQKEKGLIKHWEFSSPYFRQIMIGSTGAGVCAIVIGMGIFMMIHSTRQLRQNKKNNEQKLII